MKYGLLFIILSISMFILVVDLVRKNKLHEKYSIFWLFFSILILGLAIKPNIIDKLANWLGINYAPSLLFLLSILFVLAYNIHITTVISKQSDRIIKLTQELSILKSKLEQKE